MRDKIEWLHKEAMQFTSKSILVLMLFLFSVISYADEVFKTLSVPTVEEGFPMAGKRVRVYLTQYPEAYYVLFLPYNFTNAGKWPVIVESPGNPCEELNGLPDTIYLGYGLTQGMDYIWVCVPFIDGEGRIFDGYYWGNEPLSTVNFWLAVLDDLNEKFHIDKDKIILSGFSRGAISVSFIGNYNDLIASKWSAYFAHSYFDGHYFPGNSEERINRIQGKKILISAGENDSGKECSKEAYIKLINEGFQVTYIEVPSLGHSPSWILEKSESTTNAREWLNSLYNRADLGWLVSGE